MSNFFDIIDNGKTLAQYLVNGGFCSEESIVGIRVNNGNPVLLFKTDSINESISECIRGQLCGKGKFKSKKALQNIEVLSTELRFYYVPFTW